MLLAPGSSLGGARPKAGVKDEHGHLWIAKFPSRLDDMDVAAWEMVTHQLAIDAGIDVAEGMILQFDSRFHTYLTKRFDRTGTGARIHFASAMTLLGHIDGEQSSEASYLELVEFISRHGASVEKDLEELWRRIVFSICVKNTDDHLRNHGFLLTANGWMLSPAFDINPNPYGTGLSLNITDTANALELDLARSVAAYFRLSESKASAIIHQVESAVRHWRKVATQYRVSRADQERMSAAFD
jgi:serine/threonine-protein kinase HipA